MTDIASAISEKHAKILNVKVVAKIGDKMFVIGDPSGIGALNIPEEMKAPGPKTGQFVKIIKPEVEQNIFTLNRKFVLLKGKEFELEIKYDEIEKLEKKFGKTEAISLKVMQTLKPGDTVPGNIFDHCI